MVVQGSVANVIWSWCQFWFDLRPFWQNWSCFRQTERLEMCRLHWLGSWGPCIGFHQVIQGVYISFAFQLPMCLTRLTYPEDWPPRKSLGISVIFISGRWWLPMSVVIILTPGQLQPHSRTHATFHSKTLSTNRWVYLVMSFDKKPFYCSSSHKNSVTMW